MLSLALSIAAADGLLRSPQRACRLAPRRARIQIEDSEAGVGRALCDLIVTEYEACVASKGSFSFAISGGSMLKMLGLLDGSDALDWSKCTMGFVSHRCLPLDDDGATYAKARAGKG